MIAEPEGVRPAGSLLGRRADHHPSPQHVAHDEAYLVHMDRLEAGNFLWIWIAYAVLAMVAALVNLPIYEERLPAAASAA